MTLPDLRYLIELLTLARTTGWQLDHVRRQDEGLVVHLSRVAAGRTPHP